APIRRLQLSSLGERLIAKTAVASGEQPAVIALATDAVSTLADVAEAVVGRREIGWDEARGHLAALRPLAEKALKDAAEVVAALEAQEAERLQAFNAQRAELADLEAS